MDVSALKNDAPLMVWVDLEQDARVKVRYLDRVQVNALKKKAADVFLDQETKKPKEQGVDPGDLEVLIGQAAVVEFDGIEVDGDPLPCTPENIELLIRKWTLFANAVNLTCVNLAEFVSGKKEQTEKN